MKTVEELLSDLVAIPSVSSMDNRPVIDYVTACLDPAVWDVTFDSYTDSAGISKTNLIAFTRNATARHAELAFVCHSDTVPFEETWEEAVHPAIRDGLLYGRGSCDVKGFLSCALSAVDGLKLETLREPLALIITADEEVGCVGAKRLAAQKAFTCNQMIIGEPTGLHGVRAGKGYALATITVRGKEAHSAFPAHGHSAIFDAARIALALERVATELEKDRDPAFHPPYTTLNVGTIHGGTAKNIVPGECRLVVEWRPIPGQLPEYAAELITRELKDYDAELEVHRMDPAFAPSRTQRLIDMLSIMTRKVPATIAFGSEAAHLRPLAREVVVFGPGAMTTAHRTGEHVPLSEVHACVGYLKAVISGCLFARPAV
ncbi:MAG TPA: acetylornithine deacetylase [Bryobacteraceae bacterium]|nr:acetylornithine deacetylase [Bryobacteraceae bacterium]